jgi:hypothetical protein
MGSDCRLCDEQGDVTPRYNRDNAQVPRQVSSVTAESYQETPASAESTVRFRAS